MKVLAIYEWDVANKGEMLNEYLEYTRSKEFRAYFEKVGKENKVRISGWANGTEHVVMLAEFEDINDFSKLWCNKEFKNKIVRMSQLTDNMTMRIFYPSS